MRLMQNEPGRRGSRPSKGQETTHFGVFWRAGFHPGRVGRRLARGQEERNMRKRRLAQRPGPTRNRWREGAGQGSGDAPIGAGTTVFRCSARPELIYSDSVSFPLRNFHPVRRFGILFPALCGLCAFGLSASAAPAPPILRDFAHGRIACTIIPAQDEPVPEILDQTLPVAMRTALDILGPPPQPAALTIRIQAPPPFYKRAASLFHAEPLATQRDDEILLHPGRDPLKLAFRLGHELSHWLAYKQLPVRPPLWLDEGLANGVAAAAAEACARPLHQSVERPTPPRLDRHLFSLDELIALGNYPSKPAEVGAFYWQAEALVSALRHKLGAAEFRTYLALLSSPHPPAWDAPLRERWYFTDWDIDWLARQIRPESRQDPLR